MNAFILLPSLPLTSHVLSHSLRTGSRSFLSIKLQSFTLNSLNMFAFSVLLAASAVVSGVLSGAYASTPLLYRPPCILTQSVHIAPLQRRANPCFVTGSVALPAEVASGLAALSSLTCDTSVSPLTPFASYLISDATVLQGGSRPRRSRHHLRLHRVQLD